MEKKDIQSLKKQLEQELKLLEKELNATGRKNPNHPSDWEAKPNDIDVLASDDGEIAEKLESYEENETLLNEFEIRYNQVKKALKNIENSSSYGICSVCKKAIELERLVANPAATTCIEHKNQ